MTIFEQMHEADKQANALLKKAEEQVETISEADFKAMMNKVDMYRNQKKVLKHQLQAKTMNKSTIDIARFLKAAAEKRPLDGPEAIVNERTVKAMANAGLYTPRYALPMEMFNAISLGNASALQTDRRLDLVGANYSYFGLADLGAVIYENIRGYRPTFAATSTIIDATDKTETESAQDFTATIAGYEFSAKRLAVKATVSDQLLKASNEDIITFFNEEMIKAIYQRVQKHAISNIISNASSVVSIDTNGGALTYAKSLELKKALSDARVNTANAAVITSPAVEIAANQILLDSGSGNYLWSPNSRRFLGMQTLVTTGSPDNLTKGTGTDLSAIIMGDFSGIHIGFWGGFQVVVDSLSKASSGQLDIVLDVLYDTQVVNPGKFAVIKDITT